jgi:predicted CXXCH cytochrome family protein
MKRYSGPLVLVALVLAAAAVALTFTAEPASADGGPHGGYTATGGEGGGLPDQCAACHRVHQGKSAGKLLKATSPYALCLTCHNGTGSELDVWDGVKLDDHAHVEGVTRYVTTSDFILSVAPTADLQVPEDARAEFTLALRNQGVGSVIASFGVTDAATEAAGPAFRTTTLGGLVSATGGTAAVGVEIVDPDAVPGNGDETTIDAVDTPRAVPSDTYTLSDTSAGGEAMVTLTLGGATEEVELPHEIHPTEDAELSFQELGVSLLVVNNNPGDHVTGLDVAAGLNGRTITTGAFGTLSVAGGGVSYVDLITWTEPLAAPTGLTLGDELLTTVNISSAGGAADVIVKTIAGDPSTNEGTLNGGGFMFMAGQAVTSRHNADPADNSLNPWGYLANTGQNTGSLASPLQCTSCHNPHGTDNYRILKEDVNGQAVNVQAYYGGAFVKEEVGPGNQAALPEKYTVEFYGSSGDSALNGKGNPGIGSLCGACHTAYPSDGAGTPYTAGGTTHYRHKTEMPYNVWSNPESGRISDNPETAGALGVFDFGLGDFPNLRLASSATQADTIVTCLTCHRAHGTNTTMAGYALKGSLGGRSDEDLSPAQTAESQSTLLYTDNRGMCQACHQWGATTPGP